MNEEKQLSSLESYFNGCKKDEKGDMFNSYAPFLPEYLALPIEIKFWKLDRPQLGIMSARVQSVERAKAFLKRIAEDGYEGVHIQ